MKNSMVFMVLGIACFLGCSQDKVRDFMPGIYVNSAGGEFSVASDTLEVELVEGRNYIIHRKTGFNMITDGKPGKREYETEEWKTIYNSESQSLTETRKGKLITFFPEMNSLSIGRRLYNKIN